MVKSILPDCFKIDKQIHIKGNKRLIVFFYLYLAIIWVSIVCWVIYNNGYIKTHNYMLSTVTLQTYRSIKTNYSKEDFDMRYVKENEIENYNKVWDRSDFVDYYPNEIHFMTNMLITSNQTKGICPNINFVCDLNNPCIRGTKSQNGILTGNCIHADYPYGSNSSVCEVEGWCPVGGNNMPLKGNKPVLIDTINSTISIFNTVEFPNEDIVINNLMDDISKCNYDPQTNPYCESFKLGDFIRNIANVNFTYEDLAQYGAYIIIKIDWDCYLPLIQQFDCRPKYSFRKVDRFNPIAGSIYYLKAIYYQNGYSRQLIKSHKIRFEVQVKGSMSKFDLFSFITTCSAYFGISSLMVVGFIFCVKYKYRDKIIAEIVNVGDYQEIPEDNESNEQAIIIKDNEESL